MDWKLERAMQEKIRELYKKMKLDKLKTQKDDLGKNGTSSRRTKTRKERPMQKLGISKRHMDAELKPYYNRDSDRSSQLNHHLQKQSIMTLKTYG